MIETRLAKPELKSCSRCKLEARTIETICPRCRKPLDKQLQIRFLGGLMMFFGLLSMAVTGLPVAVAYQRIAIRDGSGLPVGIVCGVLGVMLLYAFSMLVVGIWHLATGRRNRLIIWTVFALAFVLQFVVMLVPAIFTK